MQQPGTDKYLIPQNGIHWFALFTDEASSKQSDNKSLAKCT